MKIGYQTEDPARDYAKAIRAATNATELVSAIEPFAPAVEDALEIARTMTDADFKEFRAGEKKQRTSKDEKFIEAFVRRFGAVLMPEKMLEATLVSMQMHVPWGLAFIRLEDDRRSDAKKDR